MSSVLYVAAFLSWMYLVVSCSTSDSINPSLANGDLHNYVKQRLVGVGVFWGFFVFFFLVGVGILSIVLNNLEKGTVSQKCNCLFLGGFPI